MEGEVLIGSGAFKIQGKRNFPSGPVIKNPPANAGNESSIPGLGR